MSVLFRTYLGLKKRIANFFLENEIIKVVKLDPEKYYVWQASSPEFAESLLNMLKQAKGRGWLTGKHSVVSDRVKIIEANQIIRTVNLDSKLTRAKLIKAMKNAIGDDWGDMETMELKEGYIKIRWFSRY